MTTAQDVAEHLVTRVSTTPAGQQVLSPVDLVFDIDGVEDQNVFILFEAGDDFDNLVDNLYPGIVIAGPAVFLVPTGGFARIDYMADTADELTPAPQDWPGVNQPTLQVLIRSEVGEPQTGYDLAIAVYQGLSNSPPSGYFASRAASSEPRWLREDGKNRALYGFNLTLQIECLN